MTPSPRGRAARLPGLLLAAGLILAPGCSHDHSHLGQPLPPESLVPDFTLSDVNPNSATSGRSVSPRGHLGAVSAWYFGHAT